MRRMRMGVSSSWRKLSTGFSDGLERSRAQCSLAASATASDVAISSAARPRRPRGLETREHFGWIGCDLIRGGSPVSRITHTRVSTLDRQRTGLIEAMLDFEARAAALDEVVSIALVAEPRRLAKAGARFHQRMSGEIVGFEIVDLVHAERALDQRGGAGVENLEIARIEMIPAGSQSHHSMRMVRILVSILRRRLSAAPCATPRRAALLRR